MPNAVYVLWWILLIVVVLAIPYLVYLLHKAWGMAHSIDLYCEEILKAGDGIAHHTENIKSLNKTVVVVREMLPSAGTIVSHSAALEKNMDSRAQNLKKA